MREFGIGYNRLYNFVSGAVTIFQICLKQLRLRLQIATPIIIDCKPCFRLLF